MNILLSWPVLLLEFGLIVFALVELYLVNRSIRRDREVREHGAGEEPLRRPT